ncbi:hypothetical protein N7517_006867 [Penicillium concentricum]|uniref:Major facilitator superfamily (MFS) profile domain-containing protein n=1 Tax=Penicillium concentricum TaxID=293559 RepID=A0A9W9VCY6_9EURO|nr:uncharacterized protein N7517_006867 [Penicillium concentricum]KAJ5374861.1 hypothetical protein N7517_006867 [Penicillium concentricum]
MGSDKNVMSSIWRERRIISISFFIAMAQFQYGYDSAAVSGFQTMPGFLAVFGYVDPENILGYNIKTTVQTLLQSLMQLGGLVASLVIFKYGSWISNRWGLWTGCALSCLAIILQISNSHLPALYVGRVFLGISNGFFLTYSVTYLGEIAPTHLRGSTVGLVTFQTSFGALIGIIVDKYTTEYHSRLSYRIPLGIMFFVPVMLSIGLVFLPESPRYYVRRGLDAEAAQAIRCLRGAHDESQLEAEVSSMRQMWIAESMETNHARLIDAFRGADLKRTFLSLCCSVGQTASGIIFLSNFSVYFYAQAGVQNEFQWVMMSLAIAITGNMGAFVVMQYFERRTLLGTFSVINGVIMMVIAAVYTNLDAGSYTAARILIAMGTLSTWSYGLGQGPVLWALQVEIPSQRLRSKTVGLGTGCNYVFAWVAAYCSPYFINPTALNWGPKYCYLWGGSNFLLAIWAFLMIPDIKGKTLEQITSSMAQKDKDMSCDLGETGTK